MQKVGGGGGGRVLTVVKTEQKLGREKHRFGGFLHELGREK